jgi:hypothetical protein
MNTYFRLFNFTILTTALTIAMSVALVSPAHAKAQMSNENLPNIIDELDPFDPNIESQLRVFDAEQEQATGMPSWLDGGAAFDNGCFQFNCHVYALVIKSQQKLFLYVDGALQGEWLVSTGIDGRETPDLDTHPDGRIYDRYSSTKFPGGDFNGLGNMPYAVFIQGGFAIHGTPEGNWKKLGTRASHGCVRVHPDNALAFNRMVRESGVQNVWVTIRD